MYVWRKNSTYLRKGMPGVALVEYTIEEGTKEKVLIDLRREMIRPIGSTICDDWSKANDYSIVQEGKVSVAYRMFVPK